VKHVILLLFRPRVLAMVADYMIAHISSKSHEETRNPIGHETSISILVEGSSRTAALAYQLGLYYPSLFQNINMI
jgi:hypothetical protein